MIFANISLVNQELNIFMLTKISSSLAPKQVINALETLFHQGRIEDILARAPKILEKYPDTPSLYNILGVIFFHQGCKQEAANYFRKTIDLLPKDPDAYNNLGNVCKEEKKYEEAILNYEKAIQIKPNYLKAYKNLFVILQIKNDITNSEKLIKKAIKIFNTVSKKNILAWKNWIVTCLHEIAENYESEKDCSKAKKNYYKAIQIKNDHIPSLNNLGVLLFEEGLEDEALKYFKIAKKFKFKNVTILNNIALIYFKKRNYFLSTKYLEKAINLKQGSHDIFCNLMFCFMNIFKDKEANKFLEILKNDWINHNNYSNYNFTYLDQVLFSIVYSSYIRDEEIYKFYQLYDKKFKNINKFNWQPFPQIKKNKPKLKIGYVSPDFKKHSIQNFLKPVLKNHNHEQFEIYAFAELSQEDSTTLEYKSYVDQWVPTQGFTDLEMAQKIRKLEIDILVDVAGHTKGNRLGIFAYKPTPVSCSWMIGSGYTSGLSAIDYFLTDEIVAPQGSEHLFSEKIWRINDYCYFCYEEKAKMGKVGPLPALAKGYITFGTLTRSIRINDRVIKVWAEILKRVKNSKLVINSSDFNHYKTKRMIISKFKEYEVDSDRLEIGYQSPPWDLMRQIDIALDCFPHNSGTTLIEHLFMGNPFITFSNRPGVGKIGSSILSAIGHSEWIATTEDEYVQKAVNLASGIEKLDTIRGSLRKEIEKSPIMNHRGFVKKLEKVYKQMWEEKLVIK